MTKREALARLKLVAESLTTERLLKLLQCAYNVQAEPPSDFEMSNGAYRQRKQHESEEVVSRRRKQQAIEELLDSDQTLEAGRAEREP